MKRVLIPIAILAWACSSDSGGGKYSVTFEPDPEPTGAAVYVNVELAADSGEPVATVWAARLGSVFGIALHVEFDGEIVAATGVEPGQCLGADAEGEAAYLTSLEPVNVALGAVRRGPSAGEVEITEPVAVGQIPFEPLAKGSARIELRQVQVRRADGSFTPVEAVGGLVTVGGAS